VTDIEPTAANDTPAVPLALDTARPEPETQSIADRVKAAQVRIAERTAPARAKASEKTKEYSDTATKFVKEHPALAITGAVVAGAAIAFALPGRPGRKLRGGALAVGGLIAEVAATYGAKMLTMAEDAATTSQEKLDEIGESFAAASGSLADSAAEAGTSILGSVRHAGEATASQAQSLIGKIKR